jgi:hypothetical protein
LDNKGYQNLNFDLADDGSNIVIQRINRQNQVENNLWVISTSGKARSLGIQAEQFMISPDGKSLAIVEGRGISLNPLTPDAKPLEFYPGYNKILGFVPDRDLKLMVKINEDRTESLFVVADPNTNRELFKSNSSILECKLEPRQETSIFCIKSLYSLEQGQYQEEIYLAVIDLTTGESFPLLALPNYRDVTMNLSSDGIALLFDQVVVEDEKTGRSLLNQKGQAIAAARLWLLPLPDIQGEEGFNRIPAQELVPGFKAQWLP